MIWTAATWGKRSGGPRWDWIESYEGHHMKCSCSACFSISLWSCNHNIVIMFFGDKWCSNFDIGCFFCLVSFQGWFLLKTDSLQNKQMFLHGHFRENLEWSTSGKLCFPENDSANIWMFPKTVVPSNHPILIGFSIINHPFWGSPIFGNTHIFDGPEIMHHTPGCFFLLNSVNKGVMGSQLTKLN